jgi:hypothetical protein
MIYSAIKRLGQNLVYPLEVSGVFQFEPQSFKIDSLSLEISKSGNLNIPLKFSVKMGGN